MKIRFYIGILLILMCVGLTGCQPHMWVQMEESFKNIYYAGYMQGEMGGEFQKGWEEYNETMKKRLGLEDK